MLKDALIYSKVKSTALLEMTKEEDVKKSSPYLVVKS